MSIKRKDIKKLIGKLNKVENVSKEVIQFLKDNYFKMFDDAPFDDAPVEVKPRTSNKTVRKFVSLNKGKSYSFAFNKLSESDWSNIVSLLKEKNRLKAVAELKRIFKQDLSLIDAKYFIDDFYLIVSND